ncbi:hypothetical protein FHT69_006543 [Rhizobium sp. BK008]|nr:hypothetical protein [Rhizobium sp. BK008]
MQDLHELGLAFTQGYRDCNLRATYSADLFYYTMVNAPYFLVSMLVTSAVLFLLR